MTIKITREHDDIVIRVPEQNIITGFEGNPETEDVNEEGDVVNYRVTDVDEFIKEFVTELRKECPDTGLTLTHRAFDKAFMEMLEQGAFGISDEKEIEG